MEIGSSSYSSYFPPARAGGVGGVGKQDTSTAVPSAKAEETEEKSLIEEIREKGFAAYAEELKEKRKEELRAKILEEMGLNEEALAKLSPEARAQIEKMIAAEIRKRMTAEAEVSKQQEGQEGQFSLHSSSDLLNDQTTMAQIDDAGVGIGPLLALQEIERQAEENGDGQVSSVWDKSDKSEKVAG